MNRKIIGMAGVVTVSLTVSGCVAPAPVVAIPGQGKTYQQFHADDTACRGGPAPAPAAGAAPVTGATQAPAAITPEAQAAYLQCMTAHGNTIASVPSSYSYPWYTYGYSYPWLYPAAYPYWGPYYGWGGWWGSPFWGGPFWGGPGFGVSVGFGRFNNGYGYYHDGFGAYHGGFQGGFHGGFHH
jgi:hypothetical protein